MTTVETTSEEDQVSAFESYVGSGGKYEIDDSIPPSRRRHLARLLASHAHSESAVGMQAEADWITRAPSLRRKSILLAKVQDEGGHGLYLYGVAEALGMRHEEALQKLCNREHRYTTIVDYPAQTWADVLALGWLVDGIVLTMQVPMQRVSFGPYARAMTRICREESFHQRQGFEGMAVLAEGSPAQRAMAQGALDRLWFPALGVPGPPNAENLESDVGHRMGLQPLSSEEIRQRFVDQVAPQAAYLGLQIPDPHLRWNKSRAHFDFTDPDWHEWLRVYRGDGPCSAERVERVAQARREGAWAREAAAAFASHAGARCRDDV